MNENYFDLFYRLKAAAPTALGVEETEEERRDRIRRDILDPIVHDIERGARGAIPAAVARCYLGNFSASPKALEVVKGYAETKKEKRDEGINFIIQGNAGVGKTHLAAALTWELLVKSPRMNVDFWPIVDLVSLAKAVFEDDGQARFRLEDMGLMDFVVLDDLGQERRTDWTRELIFTLISRRYNNRRPTIVTTNLESAEIADRYGDSVASRLFGGGAVVLKFGAGAADFRMKGGA